MKSLLLTPIGSSTRLNALPVDQSIAQSSRLQLSVDDSGQLEIQRNHDGEQTDSTATISAVKTAEFHELRAAPERPLANRRLVGDLFFQGSPSSWFLALHDPNCGINHQTPPLDLAKLEPGALLSIGAQFWHVATVWVPAPFEVPVELKTKPCPVCGAPLGEVPVVQCACGRYMHLERPETPDDADALNCFLAVGVCGGCHQPTSLEPQVSPALPLCLADWASDEDLELPVGAL